MKSIAAPAGALLLALALAACGGDEPPAASPTPSALPDPAATPAPPIVAPAPPPMASAPVAPSSMPVTTMHVVVSPEIRAIIDAPDRDAADKKLDAGRKPGEMLAFAGIKPGMKVAEIGAFGGYTTELLARAVGPTGTVYGQNTQGILDKFAAKPWAARLAKPVNKKIVSVVRDFEDPLPPEAHDLDAVVINLFYHDTVWLKVDPAKMNGAIFRALKPGGVYIVIDHSSKAGSGKTEAQTTHRIEESVVRQEVSASGFTLVADADFLRNPADTRDWSTSPSVVGEKRGTSDRFVLKFAKP